MPPGCATWQEAGVDAAWTTSDYLLADTVDALNWANYQRGDGKGKKPDPVPRPEQIRKQRDKRQNALDRAARFKERKRNTK